MQSRHATVVIGDPSAVFLRGLASVLKPAQGFKVLAQCTEEQACLRAIRALCPDFALLDTSLVSLSRFGLLRELSEARAHTRLIVFAPCVGKVQALAASLPGSYRVLPKEITVQNLLRCMRLRVTGREFPPAAPIEQAGIPGGDVRHDRLPAPVTAREQQIIGLVSQGLSNKEIGRELDLAAGTVKIHLHRIYQKLAIHNRTTLAVHRTHVEASHGTSMAAEEPARFRSYRPPC
ncbi:MAG: response regulator transcription factor [Bradyrhizobiaceae bacterium]|nr:response regulator transcription factor [Hyphomicrobiales bacterium]MBV9426631.1 response regulator transcription factor [Bradyrhizobiaceae bacterium]